jgi:F-type H+-transporting ATPase subunit delta
MAETITIARPYARAAFEQAYAAGDLNKWSALLQAAALVAGDASMRSLLGSPRLSSQERADLVLGICSEVCKEGIPEVGRNFVLVLAENRRLDVLPQISVLFEGLRAEAEKTIQAQLVTAFAVSDAQRKKVAKALKARLKRDVELECAVDESLIGGAIIRAGDLVIDGSVRGQLDKLAAALRH